ncbi:MAG: tetratricopeptide repeat protein [SAR324 cluster bacterium]|uniref:Tetratricopeptide repeat protein n=1 Tax=SAR324 cluster bacterium TaxID=2024889 RepID=A0A7X9IJG1_9DELT|nr:tetratricopeptide repeat protein [SAR324 cluster bacterium]
MKIISFAISFGLFCFIPEHGYTQNEVSPLPIQSPAPNKQIVSKTPHSQVMAKGSSKKVSPIINKASLEMNEEGSKAMQAKDFAKAEELFKKALDIDPKNITASFNLAGAYLMNKKNQEAIQLLNHYILEYPNDPGLYSRLGEAYFASKDLPNAEKNFKKALEIYPQYPGTPVKLATIYSLQQKFNEAEAMFLIAIEQEPRNGDLLANLAGIFLANGKAQEAINTAKRALQVKPSSEIYLTMGLAYERLKDRNNAIISFQRAFDLGDTRSGLKEKIEALKAKAAPHPTASPAP